MRALVAGVSSRGLIAGVALLLFSTSAVAAGAATPPFTPTPCSTALYQTSPVFTDGQTIVNDCRITIHSAVDVAAERAALIQFIWGAGGFPGTKLPSSVDHNIPSPVAGLANLERVDMLHITMDLGEVGTAYHFIPLARKTNRLVVLSPGHACTFDDSPALTDTGYGMHRTINSLLVDGYSVLAVFMPHMNYLTPNNCGTPSHDEMFATLHPEGSVMKFFLEPIVVALNYLQTQSVVDDFPVYTDFSMVGLSGGGWTTAVYAAIDTRITLSVQVAGSMPLYLRFQGSEGDMEQLLTDFYTIAGYSDLYVMGSYGPGRRQVQVLNRHDSCCFTEWLHRPDLSGMSWDQAIRSYEWRVRASLAALGAGSFRLEIDESAPEHMISWSTVANVIMPELNQGRRTVGAASPASAFVRGKNGNLWYDGKSGWQDTRLPMVGAPAAVGGDGSPINAFYRDTSNRLMHAFIGPKGWTSTAMGGVVITDPVAVSTAPGLFDVVAVESDYTAHHWSWNGHALGRERVSTTPALGRPALLAAPGRLDIFFRGFDNAIHYVRKTAAGAVEKLLAGTTTTDSPTAVATVGPSGTTRRVIVRGADNRIWAAASVNDGPWKWKHLEPAGVTDRFTGSPSASTSGSTVIVAARTTTGRLGLLRLGASGWTYTNAGAAIVESPTAVGNGALAHGRDGTLHYYDGKTWHSKGGRFD